MDAIINQIVDRCHISAKNREVVVYAISRLRDGRVTFMAWTPAERKTFLRAVLKRHGENFRMFVWVQGLGMRMR